ncbi:MAG: methionyl-tRNA formyltransferase [Candidatus Omnitrophota bacterium]
MNIIFFGSSHFAVPSLEALIKSGHKILCVVTQPDRKKGRGLHLGGTSVKLAASEMGLKTYQPLHINTAEAITFLKAFGADLFIIISYGQILSQEILDIPRLFALNAHASLLPQYRGAAPINWALINGEKTSGVTIMKMELKMDAGPIMMQQAVDILQQDTALILEVKLAKVAQQLIGTALEKIASKDFEWMPQDEKEATFAPKLKKENGSIDWQEPAFKIHNLIRGCLVWPGAFTHYKGRLLKIFTSRVVRLSDPAVSRAPGRIIKISKQGIAVATGEGDLLIESLQVQGKKPMTAPEFLLGHKLSSGDMLEKK